MRTITGRINKLITLTYFEIRMVFLSTSKLISAIEAIYKPSMEAAMPTSGPMVATRIVELNNVHWLDILACSIPWFLATTQS
jgi:uncharacterized membrane protein (UPF0127 family)